MLELQGINMSEFSYLEGLSGVSDDFLSNGFHQFYNELHEETQIDFEFVDLFYGDGTGRGEVVQDDDFDIDQLLDLPYTSPLPEITALCSASCSSFIKESSENLKFNPSTRTPSDSIAKNLMCPYEGCQKLYAKPTHLKAHLKRHLNDKPYICLWPDCKWRFSRSDELARHRRSHLGIKPYRCTFCPKTFARSDHLTKHRRVHEKRLGAQNCGELKIQWPTVPRGRPGRKPKVRVNFK